MGRVGAGLLILGGLLGPGPPPVAIHTRSGQVVTALRRWAVVAVRVSSPSIVTFSIRPGADVGATPVFRVTRDIDRRYTFRWRGRTLQGDPVPDGAYVLEVSASGSAPAVRKSLRIAVWNDPGPPDPVPPPPPGRPRVVASEVNRLTWAEGRAPDLAHYRVYRSASPAGPYSRVGSASVEGFEDRPPERAIFFYRVSAVDISGNEGAPSALSSSDNVRVSRTIGPEGGTIAPTTGTVRLEIPPGSLEAPKTLTVEQVASPPSASTNRVLVTRVFRIEPSGTVFRRPARLSMRFDVPPGYRLPASYPADTTFGQYWDRSAHTWMPLGSTEVDAARSVVTVALPHLSILAAAAVTDPHGGYSSGTTLCGYCHAAHKAPGPNLFQRASERETCYQCHNGSGASTDIQSDFGEGTIGSSTRTSYHPVPATTDGYRLVCGSCHTAHRLRTGNTKLLRVLVGGSYRYSPPSSPIGTSFCYGCHGQGSSLPAPLGDHTGYESSIHKTSPNVPSPASGSEVKCLACHFAHGSDNTRLTRAGQEQLCYTCHTQASPNTSGGSNPYTAFTGGANDYSTSDGNGIRIFHHPVASAEQAGGTRVVECASCHNSHLVDQADDYAQGKTKLGDPTNLTLKYAVSWDSASYGMNRSQAPGTAQDISQFCAKCHVNPTTTQPVSAGTTVPYTVRLTNDTSSDAGGKAHDKFTAAQYFTGSGSVHGKGGELACTACHDFHGSSNTYMLREQVVSIGTMGVPGGQTTTVTGFQAPFTYDDQWKVKFQGFCKGCHSSTHSDRGKTCISCHYHGSVRL
ncbi:MAG: hypothetical protein HY775_05060 [Acidobacteria bacterium]|nr:hypothetical protein [Acidobacteriota bacterium]